MVRPDITFAVQQYAMFCESPNQDHEDAVKRICRYSLKTCDEGIILKPDKSRGLECHVDIDWTGSWGNCSSNNPLFTHSRTGYCISYESLR